MEKKDILDIAEQEEIGKAIVLVLENNPVFNGKTTVKLNDVDNNGLGVFSQQGSVYLNRYMDGSYKGQYNFFIGYRIKLNSDDMKSREQAKLGDLSRWLESLETYPELTDNRKILEIVRTSDVFVDGIDKDGTIYYRCNFQLKYYKKNFLI